MQLLCAIDYRAKTSHGVCFMKKELERWHEQCKCDVSLIFEREETMLPSGVENEERGSDNAHVM